jgi:hypothetical protein
VPVGRIVGKSRELLGQEVIERDAVAFAVRPHRGFNALGQPEVRPGWIVRKHRWQDRAPSGVCALWAGGFGVEA